MLSGGGYINPLYTTTPILLETGRLPVITAGQSAMFISDGTIVGTTAGGLYLSSSSGVVTPISSTGSVSGATNTGSGLGIYSGMNLGVLQLQSLVAGTGVTLTSAGGAITISGSNAYGYENISTSSGTNPSANVETTDFNLNTGAEADLTLGLPSPATPGYMKFIVVSRLTTGSSLRLAIPNFVSGNGLLFTLLGEGATLIYTAAGWCVGSAGAKVY